MDADGNTSHENTKSKKKFLRKDTFSYAKRENGHIDTRPRVQTQIRVHSQTQVRRCHF